MTEENHHHRFYRSNRDRIIAGVCGGLAEYFQIDPTLVRVVFVLLAIVPHGFGVLLYIVLAFIIPREPGDESTSSDKQKTATIRVENGKTIIESDSKNDSWRHGPFNLLGGFIILLGVSLLLRQIWPGVSWANNLFWPLVVLFIGLYLILTSKRS